jgi:hypothetical protein
MRKSQIRVLKSHYQARWAVLRHNQKHIQKLLLLPDQFVLKNLLTGDTLCYNCLGEMYETIISNLSTTADKKFNNLVLINNLEFKYKTLDQLTIFLEELSENVLVPNSRVILSFEHKFLIYDRVGVSVDTLINNWLASLKKFKPVAKILLLGKSQPGYGDYFFCLDYCG